MNLEESPVQTLKPIPREEMFREVEALLEEAKTTTAEHYKCAERRNQLVRDMRQMQNVGPTSIHTLQLWQGKVESARKKVDEQLQRVKQQAKAIQDSINADNQRYDELNRELLASIERNPAPKNYDLTNYIYRC